MKGLHPVVLVAWTW